MIWFLLSFMTALTAGASDVLVRKALKTHRPRFVSFARYAWPALFMLPFVILGPAPSNPRTFWTFTAIALPFEVLAAILYQRALQRSRLANTVPYLAFSPVFLIGTGFIILGELPSPGGIAGVLMVCLGALILQKPAGGRSWVEWVFPSDPGSRMMMVVAFLYSVTSALVKRALMDGSPVSFPGIYFGLLALLLVPFQGRSPAWLGDLTRKTWLFMVIGVFEALTLMIQFQVFVHVEVAYAISIKRLSLLVAVGMGALFLNEKIERRQMAGIVTMIVGAALIAILN